MLINQIDNDLTEAMKSKDEAKISTLRMLKSAIHNWQIANKKEPQDTDILQVAQKEIKSRKDSVEMYRKGGRGELAQKEEGEIAILEKYLPEQMSEEDIRKIVKEQIAKVNAKSIQDMGKVMGPIMAMLEGKVDGSTVSKIVKEELSK